MARARARSERWRVELPPLEDLYAVQVGIQRVLDAVAGEQLERSQAWAMLYGLQQAATNLRLPKEVWEDSDHFGDGEQCELVNFAKEHGLPEDMDVDTPPDEAFPPPAASAEAAEAPRKATGRDRYPARAGRRRLMSGNKSNGLYWIRVTRLESICCAEIEVKSFRIK